jgi:hypothetical protein
MTSIKTLLGLGPQIDSAANKPDWLLLYENNMIFSFIPLHIGCDGVGETLS